MTWFLAGASIGMSLAGGYKAKKAAKRAGKFNARMIREETNESIRRFDLRQKQIQGQTASIIGGSGVAASSGGTARNYLNSMQIESNKQREWIQRSGDMRAKLARQTGQRTGDQFAQNAIMGAFNTGANWYLNRSYNQGND